MDGLLGPALDIARTPLAGRNFESYGEDPRLTGAIGSGWISGVHRRGVVAVAKHYVGNNQETDRMTINAQIGERALQEIYLPPWLAAVTAGTSGAMAAYNRVDGTFMTENEPLLRGVLRGAFGFAGVILSDSGATHDTVAAANGGLDLEAPKAQDFTPANLSAAVASGQVSKATIAEHVRNVLRATFASGVVDRQPFPSHGPINQAGHGRFAMKVAERGTVLLRNRHRTLPITLPRREGKGKRPTIAVFGPPADSYIAGGGSSFVPPFFTVSPLDGIAARARPRARVRFYPGRRLGNAARLARAADLAIVVAGSDSQENEDLACLTLACQAPGAINQDRLIRRVASANRRTIVVLETGAPVVMPWLRRVEAVLEAWYPGQTGGKAIARVLFGDFDPGGRLPITFPRRRTDTPTAGDARLFPGLDGTASYSEGVLVGYRWYDQMGIEPRFEFGFGLSFTRFRYRRLRVDPGPGPSATVSAVVRNVGRRRGIEVAQLYLGLPDAPGAPQPPRWLKGFAAVRLGPGERRRVGFTLDRRSFSYWDSDADQWAVQPGCYRVMVGRSSRKIRLRAEIPVGAGTTC